ncbi:MAG: leucine-rich repeat protein [Bacteroidales bacterium]|nr:leucine-rich repeat protein [Bacteroidales bacterium]MCF8389900.1 leucine-rich repeat protein [Bacteroidales bacterium]
MNQVITKTLQRLSLLIAFVTATAFNSNGQDTLAYGDVIFDAATGTISNYTASYTNIIIPESFHINGEDISVTSIGFNAFYNSGLTSVTIPSSVTSIESYAFYNNDLASVTFEENSMIRSISSHAFYNNSNLTSIKLPSNSNTGFSGYVDNSNISYNAGDNIIDFTKSYYAVFDYTLTLDDVAFDASTGRITDYLADYISIIIPASFNVFGVDVNVISIGSDAFYRNNLISVSIPDGVTSIGSYAFFDNNLSSVTIPGSVTYIGYDAFYGNKLTRLTIPNSVTSIGNWAFSNNYLSSITFEGSSTISIGNMAFAFNSLSSLSIPNRVNYIGGGAFNNNYITELNGEASNGIIYARNSDGTDDNTTIISFGGSAKNIDFIPSSVSTIGEDAFASNYLNSVTIPNTVTSIGDGAFFNNRLTSVTIPNSVTSIGKTAFFRNRLTDVTIPISFIYLGTRSFNENSITQVNGEPSNGIFYARNDDGTEDNTTIVSYGGVAKDIDFIPNSVTTIGNSAFAQNSLTSVSIPNSVKTIEEDAFYNNYSSLTSVTFEENSNIRIIEKDAFSYCNSLEYITLPDNVNTGFSGYLDSNGNRYNAGDSISDFEISYYTIFDYTLTLDDVEFDPATGTIKDYLNNYVIINIPASFNVNGKDINVTTIGNSAFYYNRLISVSIPNTVTSIEEMAFYYNNLISVSIPNTVTIIGDFAFEENSLTSVTIPGSVTTIGSGAFNSNAITQINGKSSNGIIYARNNDGTDDNSTIVSYGGVADIINFIPNSVTSIEYYAFAFSDLSSVSIPNSVTSIGSRAFYRNYLTSLMIPSNVNSIGSYAFYRNNLTSVTFEQNSNIRLIGANAFYSNSGLSSIELPSNANTGFTGYMNSDGNSYNNGDNISDFATSYFAELPAYTLTINDVIFDSSTGTITDYTASYTNIIIPASFNIVKKGAVAVTAIGEYAFYGNYLTNVTLPNSVTSIESYAFAFNNLSSITIPTSVTVIGGSAFNGNAIIEMNGETSNGIIYARNNDGTEDITTIASYGGVVNIIDFIPNSVISIGDAAFSSSSLTSVTIPNSVTSIGDLAFRYNSMASLSIPQSVTLIGEDAFRYNRLTSVIFEENSNIRLIKENAFSSNYDLISITLPDNANTEFIGYKDSDDNSYNPGDNIYDFNISYYAVLATHTLTINDVSFDTITGTITDYIAGYTNIIIPESFNVNGVDYSVTSIGANAFYNKNLISVSIPNSLISIGEDGFANNGLTSISLPTPEIREGFTFTGWQNSDGTVVDEITDFSMSYEAQFTPTSTHINNSEALSLKLYPNPTYNFINFETDNPDCYSFEIHSLNGQLIYREEIEGTTKQIDMTPFSKGVYFISVRSKEYVRTEKVIKL